MFQNLKITNSKFSKLVKYTLSGLPSLDILRFPQIKCVLNDWFYLGIFEVSWCLRNQEELVWGIMVTSAGRENHEDNGFSGLKKNPKSIPKCSRIILCSFWLIL